MKFNKEDIHKNDPREMSLSERREFFSYLEIKCLLFDYISENYPEYICVDGSVAKFSIANDFSLYGVGGGSII